MVKKRCRAWGRRDKFQEDTTRELAALFQSKAGLGWHHSSTGWAATLFKCFESFPPSVTFEGLQDYGPHSE